MNKLMHLLGEKRVFLRLIAVLGLMVVSYKLLLLLRVADVWILHNENSIGEQVLYPAMVLTLVVGCAILIVIELGMVGTYLMRETHLK